MSESRGKKDGGKIVIAPPAALCVAASPLRAVSTILPDEAKHDKGESLESSRRVPYNGLRYAVIWNVQYSLWIVTL